MANVHQIYVMMFNHTDKHLRQIRNRRTILSIRNRVFLARGTIFCLGYTNLKMEAQKIWANFSVQDAKRSQLFYTQLGITKNKQNNDPKLASFLFGSKGFVIHFFEKGSKIDQYLTSDGGSNNEIMFTISAETEAEVDEWERKVKSAGGSIFKKLERDEAGYYGFGFADPDGHKFNILLMDNM
jgi:predicted lactoylglutathione lyase